MIAGLLRFLNKQFSNSFESPGSLSRFPAVLPVLSRGLEAKLASSRRSRSCGLRLITLWSVLLQFVAQPLKQLWVSNELGASVSVIDTASQQVLATVPFQSTAPNPNESASMRRRSSE